MTLSRYKQTVGIVRRSCR